MAISLFLGGVEACQYDLWYLRTLKMVTIKSAKKKVHWNDNASLMVPGTNLTTRVPPSRLWVAFTDLTTLSPHLESGTRPTIWSLLIWIIPQT